MSATSFADAKARNAAATDMLRTRDAAKARAATKGPESADADYQAKAKGQRWTGANAFDRASTGRTT